MKSLAKMNYLVAALLLYSFSPFTSVDFSGTWKLNKNKSELGEYGEMMVGAEVKIEQKSDRLLLTTTGTSYDEKEIIFTETLTFDGNLSESLVWGSAKRKSLLKWAEDGKSFTVTSTTLYEWEGEAIEEKETHIWRLGENGKTLSLQYSSSSSDGDTTLVKALYEK